MLTRSLPRLAGLAWRAALPATAAALTLGAGLIPAQNRRGTCCFSA
jgi:adenine/guanine phosphoribosyltransferase-like PRPP-binding protein